MTDVSPSTRRLIDDIVQREGGFVDHKNDRGGPTCWGITERVAREQGYKGAMRDLPVNIAREIYLARYYDAPRFSEVDLISRAVADELTDTGVNMGPQTATKFLQRALNALNRRGADYPDVAVDGSVGPGTLAALRALLKRRGRDGERVLLAALNGLQAVRYIELAESDPKQEDFAFGWLASRVTIPN